jgi:hypothetical protein
VKDRAGPDHAGISTMWFHFGEIGKPVEGHEQMSEKASLRFLIHFELIFIQGER